MVARGMHKSTCVRLLQEYVASADQAEAERCLRELAVPFFHHELVKQALLAAMEAPAAQGPLLALLSRMADSGLVSGSQMQKARLPPRTPCCMSCVVDGACTARVPCWSVHWSTPCSTRRSRSAVLLSVLSGSSCMHIVPAAAAVARTAVQTRDSIALL